MYRFGCKKTTTELVYFQFALIMNLLSILMLQKRIQNLHRHILTQRGSLGKALLRAVQRNRIDQKHDGIIQTLTKQ